MTCNATSFLRDVDVYMFDVFGTTVDWFTTVTREVARRSNGAIQSDDAGEFANEWRYGYYAHIGKVLTEDGEGSLNIDVVHREILDEMLVSPRWSHLANVWDEPARKELVHIWHDLDDYEDTLPGLSKLRESGLVIALSNGNYRLLVDNTKSKQLPWDGILSTEFFGTFKPMETAYLSAAYHLGVPPDRIAMVAAHKTDLYGAESAGLKTIYVPRPAEDTKEDRENMRSKAEGGSVDLVVKNFRELAALAGGARKGGAIPRAGAARL